ncbi:MAG: 3-dehydroquinate synthase [Parvularculaceae bacterium]
MNAESISVRLGARAYDIHIGAGLIDRTGALLGPHLHRPRTVVVTDENVAAAQGPRLEAALKEAGVAFHVIALPPGEATKSFSRLEALCGELLDREVGRDDLIVAFGGGVIGDLVGFAAAILKRGCRFAQIPTTLLAQVDSAVGGKTAINVALGKNLIGAFHQPALVIADVAALDTLPARELRAGYAEVVKYGLIGDAGFFDWLEQEGGARLLEGGAAARQRAVKTCCAMKAQIVEADETEKGRRALLNFGHTFGHAFEAAFGYSDRLLHGEAVAAGMALACDFSVDQGVCPPETAARVKAHLAAAGLPAGVEDIDGAGALDPEALFAHMMQDKKVEAGALTLVLTRGVGEAFIAKDADANAVKVFLKTKAGL